MRPVALHPRVRLPLPLAPAAMAAVAAVALAACGAPPPQAPFVMAKKLDSATSGISTACGEAFQVTAFPGDHARDLATLEATAGSSARKLASVDLRNRRWIYQGQTVAEIVREGVADLRSCHLRTAAGVLERATRR
jgi:hypothetical protein